MPEFPDDRVRAAWRSQPAGSEAVDVDRAWVATRKREADIRRRDRIVYLCAAIIAPAWAWAIWFRPDLRFAAAIGLAIALWMPFQIYRRSAARVTPASVDMVCIRFHCALLERERDLVRAKPIVFVPLVLGQLAILFSLFTSPPFPRTPAFWLGVGAFVTTAATALAIAWQRWRREAVALQREIDSLGGLR